MDEQILKALTQVLEQNNQLLQKVVAGTNGDHTKNTPASVMTAPALHGPGGIFTGPGLERDVITAHIRPEGISSILPRVPNTSTDPRYAALTGYTDVEGDEITNACEDAPYGFVKSCNLTASFGLVRRDTNTIEMDKVMLRINRGDFTDLVLRGRVLGLMDIGPSGMNEQQILNVVTMSEMVGAAVQSERALNTRYWQGTVAAGQMPGLDVQIATGQIDADTGTACPALDSDVKDFAYNDVCGTGLDIVEYMSMLQYYIRNNARKMGLMPATWVWMMRPELWYELSACWPCKYLTNRCLTANVGANVAVINDDVNTRIKDEMRQGMFIDVNGIREPVVVDDGIFEHNNINNANVGAGTYASSIYYVPLTIAGGFPTTRIEYVDYRGAQMDRALLMGKEDWWWTDAGMWSWAIEQIKWCYKLSLKTEQRIVLQTPQLAGRIDSVLYSPLQHLRSPDPASPYAFDGGVSIRGTAPLQAVWR
jgi:hypothetical protein